MVLEVVRPLVAEVVEDVERVEGRLVDGGPVVVREVAGLMHRGELDGTPEVVDFAKTLEDVVVKTVESGKMTKDLALLTEGDQDYLTTEDFLAALDENLAARLKK